MKYKHKIIAALFLIIIFFIIDNKGMAMAKRPYDYYREKLKEVDTSDGVSKEEAIIIAQNGLINKYPEEYYHIFYISRPKVKESNLVEGCWSVRFNAKFKFGYILEKIFFLGRWCEFHIDKKTGEIKMKDGGPDL